MPRVLQHCNAEFHHVGLRVNRIKKDNIWVDRTCMGNRASQDQSATEANERCRHSSLAWEETKTGEEGRGKGGGGGLAPTEETLLTARQRREELHLRYIGPGRPRLVPRLHDPGAPVTCVTRPVAPGLPVQRRLGLREGGFCAKVLLQRSLSAAPPSPRRPFLAPFFPEKRRQARGGGQQGCHAD